MTCFLENCKIINFIIFSLQNSEEVRKGLNAGGTEHNILNEISNERFY